MSITKLFVFLQCYQLYFLSTFLDSIADERFFVHPVEYVCAQHDIDYTPFTLSFIDLLRN